MIKATGKSADGRPVLILGLSHENLSRLVADEPIAFDAAEVGLEPLRVIIMAGRTEAEIETTLRSQLRLGEPA